MLVRCSMCGGKHKICKLGCIQVKCPKCDGKGWIEAEEKAAEKKEEVAEVVAEVKKVKKVKKKRATKSNSLKKKRKSNG